MKPNTHLAIDPELCGELVELEDGYAKVSLESTDSMRADDRGLIHGGFVFGVADYAAMLAVNDPNVVLGSADVRFNAPVEVGETVTAEARVADHSGKKYVVEATVSVGERKVFEGTLTTFVLDRHVLD
ncbi:MAG: thioesterase, FlK family [Myxococcota bacterium]